MSIPQTNLPYTQPPPVGGWNTKDPLDQMAEVYALQMVNVFPEQGYVHLRKGHREHATVVTSDTVETICEYSAASGTRQMIIGVNNNLYNASTFGIAPTSITGASVITNDRWQTINFRSTGNNFIIFMNGDDQPLKWDGSAMTSAAYTGIANDATLIYPISFKSRVYAIQKNTASFWAVNTVGAVEGAMTEYDQGPVLKRGGYLMALATTGKEGGAGLEDYFVVISNMGEVLVFAGSDPATNFSLVGRYFMPPPIGRRCVFDLDADSILISEEGPIPLSKVVSSPDISITHSDFSDRINNAFSEAVASYKNNFGWQGIVYPGGHYALINIPIIPAAQQSQQFVVNLLNGSWCKYVGQNASCWSLYNGRLYFGGAAGSVFEADYADSDNGMPIAYNMQTAYTYFDDRGTTKGYKLVRPLLTAATSLSFGFGVDIDFGAQVQPIIPVTANFNQSPWNTSPWNTTPWAQGSIVYNNWHGITGIGKAVSFKMQGQLQNATWQLNAINYIADRGGLL